MRVSQAPYFSVLFTDWVWIWSVAGVLNSAVAVCVCMCVVFLFFSSLGCKTARAFPMSNVHDSRSGGWARGSLRFKFVVVPSAVGPSGKGG